jgi:peroxiredoxin Q/BCP
MAQLRQDYSQFVARDTEVLIVSPEDAPTVAGFWRAQAMPMPGLVDPGHEIANRYGQQVKLLKLGRLPSMVILDRDGAVRFEHQGANMQDIPQNRDVLALLDELNRKWSKASVTKDAMP